MYISQVVLILTSLQGFQQVAWGRERWLERHNRPVFLSLRRYGHETPKAIDAIRAACTTKACGALAGKGITALLSAQPECSQQDFADTVIDVSKTLDITAQSAMVAAAIQYRQLEKNTPPDHTTSPPRWRNSVYCQKAPRNHQLYGLVQAQDPSNDPELFYDPSQNATVRRGIQDNTLPFAGPALTSPNNKTNEYDAHRPLQLAIITTTYGGLCPTARTVTFSATNPAATNPNAFTITVGGTSFLSSRSSSSATSTATPTNSSPVSAGDNGVQMFGKCSTPEIVFGVGFDGRKETSFQPANRTSFDHGSATNITTITEFICNKLSGSCGASQAAQSLCARAQIAAQSAPEETGAQADAFNAVFGIITTFADVQARDDKGNPVSGPQSTQTSSPSPTVPNVTNTFVSSPGNANPNTASPNDGNLFGTCSTPEIEFGVGFDGRRETSFQPADKNSFSQGSAQDIQTISRFICDALAGSCDAAASTAATCDAAQQAAQAAPAGTGAQADAFNAVFGVRTNFASVRPLDDQGRPVGGTNVAISGSTGSQAPKASNPPQNPAPSSPPAVNLQGDFQTFAENLGGSAPPVTADGNGQFKVEGSTFNDLRTALGRSCDVQTNSCSDAANAAGNKGSFTVTSCDSQRDRCINAADNATR